MFTALSFYLLFISLARSQSSLPTISIFSYDGYLGLRDCATSCVAGSPGNFHFGLLGFIGCPQPFLNTCYCNSNIIPQASSFISGCVTSYCSESADVPVAFSVWEEYCGSAGVTGFPMDVAAQTTAAVATSGITTSPMTEALSVPTTEAPTVHATTASTAALTIDGHTYTSVASSMISGSSNSQPSSNTPVATTGGELNVGAIAGGVVGGVVVLGAVAIIITMLILKDRRQRRFELAQPPPTQPPVYPSTGLEVDRRIPKTPAMIHAAPVYTVDAGTENGKDLDRTATADAEMDGVGRPSWPEMQG
jgi:hypothetical protein